MRQHLRSQYDRFAPWIVVAILVLSLFGIWTGVAGIFTNNRQDAQAAAANKVRDDQIRELLACFDDYADAQSTGSGEVRDATVAVDEATSIRDDALNAEGLAFLAVARGILQEKVQAEDFQRLQETLEARAEAGRALDRAQAALDEVRRENPIPAPPSEFCSVQP